MTKYSIDHPNSSEYLVIPSTIDHESGSVDDLDWEVRMARLVGLAEELPPADVGVMDGLREQAPPPESPQEQVAEQPLSSNPFAKLSLVGAGTLAIVLLAGGFLSQIMNGSHQQPSHNNPITSQEQPQPKSESEELATEVEALKTKLALSEQAEAVKEAQKTLRSSRALSGEVPTASRTPLPTPTVRTKTVYVPRIVTVERIVRVPQPSPKIKRSPTATKPNQNQAPSKSANLGNSAQLPANPRQSVPTISPPVENPQVALQGIPTTPSQAQPPDNNSLVSQGEPQSLKSVAAGNSIKAVLATAAFGETTMSKNSDRNDEDKNVFVVRLTEPLKAVDGTIALPKNTELLTEIRSLSEQGLLQLNVVKVVSKNDSTLTERSLPRNAIIVRAPQGRPLMASQFPNQSSSITGMDLGLFLLGGLGKAAELINQTQSQIVTTSTTGTIVSNTNPSPNILAGALDGGINTIVPQIAQRNQQAIAQMMQRTNIWFLPAGTEVEVYVNQLLQL
jgi:hypothetical protein